MHKQIVLKITVACTIPLLIQADPKWSNFPQKEQKQRTYACQNVGNESKCYEFQGIETGNAALDAHCKRVQNALKSDLQQAKNMSADELKKLYDTSSPEEALKLAKERFNQRGPSFKEAFALRYQEKLLAEATKQGGSGAAEDVKRVFDCIHEQNADEHESFGDLKAYPTLNDSGLLGLEKFGMDHDEENRDKKIYIPGLHNLHELPGYKPGTKFDDVVVGIYKSVLHRDVINLTQNPSNPIALLKSLKQINLDEMPAQFKTATGADIFFTPGVGYSMNYAIRLVGQLITLKKAGLFEELLTFAPKWAETPVGNPHLAAAALLKTQLASNPDVLCVQETGPAYIKLLENSGRCLPMDDQPGQHIRTCYNKAVFSKAKVIPFSKRYPKCATDFNALLTVGTPIDARETDPEELTGNFHASSRTKSDRFAQIKAFDEEAQAYSEQTGHPVRLVLTGDANSADAKETQEYIKYCEARGFKVTCRETKQEDVPTVCKERASLCAQPHKGEKKDKATKDYIMYKVYGGPDMTRTSKFSVTPAGTINMPNAQSPTDHKLLEATLALTDQ